MGNLASLNFNAATVEPAKGYTPIPAGEYDFLVISAAIKPTKSGDGQYIEVVYQGIDAAVKGKKLYDRMNIKNQNAQAQSIGQAELSSLCRAINVMAPQDTNELCNKIVRIKVGIKTKDGEQENVIKARIAPGNGIGQGGAPF